MDDEHPLSSLRVAFLTSDTTPLHVAKAIEDTGGTDQTVGVRVDDEDPTRADILHSILERLEQLSWMVSAENRVARKS